MPSVQPIKLLLSPGVQLDSAGRSKAYLEFEYGAVLAAMLLERRLTPRAILDVSPNIDPMVNLHAHRAPRPFRLIHTEAEFFGDPLQGLPCRTGVEHGEPHGKTGEMDSFDLRLKRTGLDDPFPKDASRRPETNRRAPDPRTAKSKAIEQYGLTPGCVREDRKDRHLAV